MNYLKNIILILLVNFFCLVSLNTAAQDYTIFTIAGTGISGYNGDGISADTAQLKAPLGHRC